MNHRHFFAHSILVGLLFFAGSLNAAPPDEGHTLAASRNVQDDLLKSLENLPVAESEPARKTTDYLIDPTPYTAWVARSADGLNLILENGLIRRTWRLSPNGGCVAYDNLMTDNAMLRSVRPEARVTIDGERYDAGGLIGQPNHAYLAPSWFDAMQADEKAMRLVGFEIGKPVERLSIESVIGKNEMLS